VPSMMTAAFRCTIVPSKTWSAAIARCALIGCA
jgi:hypothetical protein